jgi:C4-dicarboxylate-specific signal transduction histidine kinase
MSAVNRQDTSHSELFHHLEAKDRQISENGRKIAQLIEEQKELSERLNIVAELSEQNRQNQAQLRASIEESHEELNTCKRSQTDQKERDHKISLLVGSIVIVTIIATGVVVGVLKT